MHYSKKGRFTYSIFTLIIALSAFICVTGCAGSASQNDSIIIKIQQIAAPYSFDFISWEADAISRLIREKQTPGDNPSFQSTLRNQVIEVLSDSGIKPFPPLNFRLEEPPHLLIISPRDKIMYMERFMLRQELTVAEKENIEARCDALGVSSLVDDLGGFAAVYPPIISDNARIRYIVNTVIEEWFHQYLALRPLGFLYVLDSIGIDQPQEIITMNETLAGIVSREIENEVLGRYYKSAIQPPGIRETGGFNYSAEMRETRRQVDIYLSQQKIVDAERYMERRRQLFIDNGYQIRKLNQAYFAFHGIYGQSPASTSPLYQELNQLRAQSPSLIDFVNTVSSMTSHSELRKLLGNPQ